MIGSRSDTDAEIVVEFVEVLLLVATVDASAALVVELVMVFAICVMVRRAGLAAFRAAMIGVSGLSVCERLDGRGANVTVVTCAGQDAGDGKVPGTSSGR